MKYILGIETSCDETAAAVFNHETKQVLSNELFSQIALHKEFGGVVPEIASRSHLEKIDTIVKAALDKAHVTLDDIDCIAVTSQPGLAGSLLVGFSFAKGLAWSKNKLFLPIDHTHGHLASAYLKAGGIFDGSIKFPHIALSLSGGHSSLYLVESHCNFTTIGNTIDDAAGEAFDKIAKIMGLGYPGGPVIEKMAEKAGFKDYFDYPRTKDLHANLNFTFSGLKTAVFYDMIERKFFDLKAKAISPDLTEEQKCMIASSLLVCIGDIICAKVKLAVKQNPQAQHVTFVGGVACNRYLGNRLATLCEHLKISYKNVERIYSTDNAAMIATAASCFLSEEPYASQFLSKEWEATMLTKDIKC